MANVVSNSAEFTLTLDLEEREQLLGILQQVLKTTLVEEHRTEASDYREYVQRKENILNVLIDRLRRS